MSDQAAAQATHVPIVATDPTKGPMDALRARLKGEAPPAAPPPPGDQAKIDIPPAQLKATVKRERELREARERIKSLEASEARAKEAEPLLEAKRLYGEGKRLEAIALLSGADATAEMETLLSSYLEQDGGAPPVDEVKKRLDEIDAKLAADEQARKDAAAQAAKDAADADRQKGVSYAEHVATKHAATFELCAREANRSEAAQAALDGVIHIVNEREIDLEKLSPDETEKLFVEAYAGVEAQLEEEGKAQIARYTKAPKAAAQAATPTPARPPAAPPVQRAAVALMPGLEDGPKTPDAVWERARQRANERMRGGT